MKVGVYASYVSCCLSICISVPYCFEPPSRAIFVRLQVPRCSIYALFYESCIWPNTNHEACFPLLSCHCFHILNRSTVSLPVLYYVKRVCFSSMYIHPRKFYPSLEIFHLLFIFFGDWRWFESCLLTYLVHDIVKLLLKVSALVRQLSKKLLIYAIYLTHAIDEDVQLCFSSSHFSVSFCLQPL